VDPVAEHRVETTPAARPTSRIARDLEVSGDPAVCGLLGLLEDLDEPPAFGRRHRTRFHQ
jgi:hypothetical protein